MESLHAFQLDPCAASARCSLTGCVLRTGSDRRNLITGAQFDLADLCGDNRVAAFGVNREGISLRVVGNDGAVFGIHHR